jgi:hypothetical protein
MPKFNLAPVPAGIDLEDLKPTYQPREVPTRARENQRIEQAAASVPGIGPVLKPMAQFMNTLASPDTKMGIVTGPVNGISKLGNAIGDLVQRKPIDTKDAWTINDKTARQLNPWRIGIDGQEVTPADEAGLQVGGGIGAEILGAVTGAVLINRAKDIARLKAAADAMKATQAVRRAAVAVQASPKLKAGVNVAKNVGEALVGTTLAAPFMDAEQGNTANLLEAAGLKLPGRVEDSDNYLQALGKNLAVDGLAAPLTLIGAGSLIKPIRRGLTSGDVGWIKDLADAELEPYMPRPMAGPALPPARSPMTLAGRPADPLLPGSGEAPALPAAVGPDAPALPPGRENLLSPAGTPGAPALPAYTQQGGALVPYDSAIGRSLQEQTQIRQVTEQRQRLQDMGLLDRAEGGQLELNVGQAVDPEIRSQIQQLQVQRGQLLQAMKSSPDQAQALDQQLAGIDQQIGDLNMAGQAKDFMPGERFSQPELDLPDGRPELDTYLAHLDEMDDRQLREVHSRVWREVGAERSAQELTAAQTSVEGINERIADIQIRAEAGKITATGAKRLLTKAQKDLADAQQQIASIEGRRRLPETLVGDQLTLDTTSQLGLDLSDKPELPPLREMVRSGSEYGYQTPDDYRAALQGWNRDLLRRLAMPDSSPEVAALVKARTGRRVWQAKKGDIIDALVELSQRRNSYLPPEPPVMEQGVLRLTTNSIGADAPLLDVPANLDVPGMGKILDADGNEVLVPLTDFKARGMDVATRERLKGEILRRAIDNGEVQAPVTPIPERPRTTFKQGSLVDELMADPTGQLSMMYSTDQLPTYKAGGKGADELIEEMRLRFEYNALDGAAQQAQRDAYLAEKGWNDLDWEEKKQLGILGEGFYSLEPFSERFQPPTAAFNPELQVQGTREPSGYQSQHPVFTPQEPPAPREPALYRSVETPAARSDLDAADLERRAYEARVKAGVEPPRKAKTYAVAEWALGPDGDFIPAVKGKGGKQKPADPAAASKPEGQADSQAAAPAAKSPKEEKKAAAEAAAKEREAAAAARRADAMASRARERQSAAIKAEMDQLLKQSKGASC